MGVKHTVVVLIITYQEELSDYEKMSLSQCLSVLKNYQIRIVKPSSVNISSWQIEGDAVRPESFPDDCFKGIGAYSRLLLSREFYQRFDEFEYLLIYQLDAFVFRDELIGWCEKGFDYIGAPWFDNFSNDAQVTRLMGVGNGGLSLRKVSSHLKVLQSFSYLVSPKVNWKERFKTKPKRGAWLREVSGFIFDLLFRNNTFWYLNSFKGFEDQFWGLIATRNFKWYLTPSCEEAMRFSFEMQPQRLYDLTNHQLPFGCHAWWKYDFQFWKPHIEKFGFKLNDIKSKPVNQHKQSNTYHESQKDTMADA